MQSPIKFFDSNCSINYSCAKQIKEKLIEVGYFAKILYYKNAYEVAYCYRDFTLLEAETVMSMRKDDIDA